MSDVKRQQQDRRVGGIDFAIGGLAGKIGGKLAARGVDGGLHVARGGVDVAVQIELQSDVGGAEAAGGSHLRDAGDAAELALERSGHGGGHGFRTGARQAGADGDGREIDLRQRSNRQKPEGNGAGKKNGDGNQRRGDRPANKGSGEVGREVHRSNLRVRPGWLSIGIADVEHAKRCASQSNAR